MIWELCSLWTAKAYSFERRRGRSDSETLSMEAADWVITVSSFHSLGLIQSFTAILLPSLIGLYTADLIYYEGHWTWACTGS
ncbi:hypothetical protein Pyn_35399 [Prunus yedoensis var. nudiflora]|uniref:Uncharacterized protein n=1 Tax=Prunus yedoensis var. nudiflora TaxID=2094558 RepID=A0A314XKI5_PRUYE|nr:hypothetical protein Pyn_35399 [Prunus yedoensis var. nudiflora]